MQRWLWLLPLHASALITKARWGSIMILVCKQPSNCSLPLDANLRCAIDASLAASFNLCPLTFPLKLSFSDIFLALLHITNNSQGSSFTMKILVCCLWSQSPSAMLGTHTDLSAFLEMMQTTLQSVAGCLEGYAGAQPALRPCKRILSLSGFFWPSTTTGGLGIVDVEKKLKETHELKRGITNLQIYQQNVERHPSESFMLGTLPSSALIQWLIVTAAFQADIFQPAAAQPAVYITHVCLILLQNQYNHQVFNILPASAEKWQISGKRSTHTGTVGLPHPWSLGRRTNLGLSVFH